MDQLTPGNIYVSIPFIGRSILENLQNLQNEVIATSRREVFIIQLATRAGSPPHFRHFEISGDLSGDPQVTGTNPTNRHAFSNRHMIGWQLYPQHFPLSPYSVPRLYIERSNLAISLGFCGVPNPLLPLDSYSAIDAEDCD